MKKARHPGRTISPRGETGKKITRKTIYAIEGKKNKIKKIRPAGCCENMVMVRKRD